MNRILYIYLYTIMYQIIINKHKIGQKNITKFFISFISLHIFSFLYYSLLLTKLTLQLCAYFVWFI